MKPVIKKLMKEKPRGRGILGPKELEARRMAADARDIHSSNKRKNNGSHNA